MSEQPNHHSIRDFLKRVHRLWILHRAARWLFVSIGVLLGLFWILTGIEHFQGLPVIARVALWVVLGAAALAGLGLLLYSYFLRVPIRRRALDLEAYAPELREQLITAIDVEDTERARRLGYADWLIEHTIGRAGELLSRLDLKPFWARAGAARGLRWLIAGVAATVVLGLLFGTPADRALHALTHPTEEIPRPAPFAWQVTTAPDRILQYEDIQLVALADGPRPPASAQLQWRYGDAHEWFTEELSPAPDEPRRFDHTLAALPQSITYRFAAHGITSAEHGIAVTRRPELTAIKSQCSPPDYTGIATFPLESGEPRWIVPEGSRIRVRVESDRELAGGQLEFDDESQTPLQVDGKTGEASFSVPGGRTLRVVVIDTAGFSNFDPVPIDVETVPDLPPQVALLEPGGDRDIPEAMTVPLVAALLDDYGFSRLELVYHVQGEDGERPEQSLAVKLPTDFGREGIHRFSWSLSDLRLFPGDRVIYRLRAYDNRRPEARWAETQTFVLRLPTLDEIIAETEREQSLRTDEVADAVERQNELAEELRELARRMVGQDQPEWEDRQQLEQALQTQEQLAENLQEWADEIEQEAEKLAQNRMTSLELVQKMNEISRLLREVMTPELEEQLERLREALKSMTPEEMQQALEDFQMSEEELLKQLERTLAQLRQMQLEQMMENMMRLAERLAENQEEQNRGVENAPDQRALDSMAREEEALREELNELQQQAEELARKVGEFNGRPEMLSFAQTAGQCKAGGSMEAMTRQMQSGQKQEASQSGQQASQQMREMLAQMQNQMMQMQSQMSAEQIRDLQALAQRSLELSREQETAGDSTRNVSSQSLALREMARQQLALRKGIENLIYEFDEQAKNNLFLSPDVRRYLKAGERTAEDAIRTLNERNGMLSQSFQYETMFSLNEATKSLMESMENQSQCKGGQAGMNSMNSGMQNLSQQQLQLNQSSQAMQNPYGLTPQEQQAVQRLAGQQQSIQREMQELAEQYGRDRDRLGRLDEIAKSMDEVIGEMEHGKLSEAALERQRNIYNRMLDFQKSLQRQDFENRRRSRGGRDVAGRTPDPLDLEVREVDSDAERWERFQNEWYPASFRALVKEYFESVARENGGTR